MIDVVIPTVFAGFSHVNAIFTKANRSQFPSGNKIQGFNFGITTNSDLHEVESNYQLLLQQLGLEKENLVLGKQSHGTGIKVVSEAGIYPETDGFITTSKKLYLGIQVADCAAILIADPRNNIAGAFHAGWRGAINGILPKGLAMMKEEGGNNKYFHAFISPCISHKAFEVGEEVAQLFPDEFCDRYSYKKTHIDLTGYIISQLTGGGIPPKNIEVSDSCTFGNSEYFSYRREREKAGRMLALIGFK